MHQETNWDFYLSPQAAWDAMYEDCRKATKSIDFEQYIFVNDDLGLKFFELLKQKAASGVRVRVLCDMVGSLLLYSSVRAYRELVSSGIEVLFFNPIAVWRVDTISSWFFRDHRKILIVDNILGYTGGVGINARMAAWRDTQVRITGPVVSEMSSSFNHLWEVAYTKRYKKTGIREVLTKNFHFITNAPRPGQRFLYHGLVSAIRGAKKSIFITTPYFIPDLRLFRILRLAAKRSVDVRILTGGASDHRVVDIAAHSYFGLAMKAGIKIYQYESTLIHAKTFVIDDDWAAVGSANLDNLSLLFNYEGNIVSTDPQFSAQLREQFFTDLAGSTLLHKAEWDRRPWYQKLLEILTWPLHDFL